MQRLADLADSGIDAVIHIKKDVSAPNMLGDLVTRHQLSVTLDQQDEQLHREFFQAQKAVASLQSITGLIKSELAEMELLGRKSPMCLNGRCRNDA